MRETAERLVPLQGLDAPQALAEQLEKVAEEMARHGWWFVTSATDEYMDTVTLFFEREIES